MATAVRISKPVRRLEGDLVLDGSKSISNRALIMLALAGASASDWLSNCSDAKDTRTLASLLAERPETCDVGDAGTAFRFLTAFLALQPGERVLTGSVRMQQRPVGPLVDALRRLGARIDYLGAEGCPPLRIRSAPLQGGRVRIDGGVSSQFLSALLMIGPYLEHGLVLEPEGVLVSKPYLDMTIRMMRYFGASVEWEGASIRVAPGAYQPRFLTVEADWSAASYWYAMAAFSEEANLHLRGVFADSLQGDAVVARLGERFGVETVFNNGGVHLTRSGGAPTPRFEWDFIDCPDLAQTFAVLCAGCGVEGHFTGLQTLFTKETDRVYALRQELAKVGVGMQGTADGHGFILSGKAAWSDPPRFASWGDHRMAMACATLSMLGPVVVEAPEVVRKSYPRFWEHLAALDFELRFD